MIALRCKVWEYACNETGNAQEGKAMITINRAAVEEIKAEAAEFGFQATEQSIARDYFARMSYEDKAAVIAMVQPQKGVAALSRACIAKVSELIAA